MDSGMVFHAAVLDLRQGYIVPRSYCRLKARRASPEDQLPLKDTTESKLHLTLLGVCGLSADLLSIAWAINPKWLTWSNLSLPPWLRWLGVLGAVGAVWLGYSLLMVERSGHEGQMLIERFGDEYRACVPRRGPRRRMRETNHRHEIQHGGTALTVRRGRIWKVSQSSEPSSLSY